MKILRINLFFLGVGVALSCMTFDRRPGRHSSSITNYGTRWETVVGCASACAQKTSCFGINYNEITGICQHARLYKEVTVVPDGDRFTWQEVETAVIEDADWNMWEKEMKG